LGSGDGVGSETGEIVGAFGEDAGDWRQRWRQIGNGIVGRFEIEGCGEVADGATTPISQIGNFGAETRFEETQDGGVIESLRGDEPPAAERRNEQHWDAKTQANGTGNCGIADDGGIGNGGCGDKFAGRPGRSRRRRNVIEEAAVFIEGEQKKSFGPQRRIRK